MDTTIRDIDNCEVEAPQTQTEVEAPQQIMRVKLDLRPIVVDQLLEKLNDDTIVPRQKIDMCFNSKVYSALLDLEQRFSICETVTIDTNIYYYYTFVYTLMDEKLSLKTSGKLKKDVEVRVYKRFIAAMKQHLHDKYPQIEAQMDSTQSTEQGPDNAEGEKNVNTIMTRDEPIAINTYPLDMPQGLLKTMCTGQETPAFPIWQERKILLSSGNLSVNDRLGQLKQFWVFPRDLYNLSSTPINRPFEQFMFTRPNITFNLKVNSQKFATGRYLLGYTYEPFSYCNRLTDPSFDFSVGALAYYNGIMRDHVYIDLGESNEGQLNIAFRNKTPFTTSLTNNARSFRGAANVTVYLFCITEMRIGDSAKSETPYTVFISAGNTEFSGMRYAITPEAQMGNQAFKDTSQSFIAGIKQIPVIGGLLGGAAGALGHLAVAVQKPFRPPATIKAIEDDLKYIGILGNRDKPTNFHEPTEFRPNATGSLCYGTNIAESIHALRLDPTATNINALDHAPEPLTVSLQEFTRVWSLAATANWSVSNGVDDLLFSRSIAPGGNIANSSDTYTSGSFIDCLSMYYTYYHGEVEFRFDIIANQFHTGILKCGFVPYHAQFTNEQANSGYWKIFDLREQKSFTFTVPYLSNTVCRLLKTASNIQNAGLLVPSPGNIKLFVVNPLNPIESAPAQVSVLVYMRGAENFRFSYPKPVQGAAPNGVFFRDISYGDGIPNLQEEVDAQMDTGEKEEIDQTPDFPHALYGGTTIQTNEDHMHIKNLMRRWTSHGTITLAAGTTWSYPVVLWNTRLDGFPRTLQQFIQRQFRWYRGSLRYMFVADNNASIISITHLPQSNACFYRQIPSPLSYNSPASKHFAGMASELFVTSINPVFKVEVPWHGVFDYLDCQYAMGIPTLRPTPWIDRAATNLGMFLITADRDVTINILISAGDDCEFIKPNFILATPNQFNLMSGQRTVNIDQLSGDDPEEDEHKEEHLIEGKLTSVGKEIDAQMDEVDDPLLQGRTGFSPFNLTTPNVSGFCTTAYNRITNSMSSALETPKALYQTAREIPGIKNRIMNTVDNMDSALEYIKDAARNIANGIKSSCTWVTNVGAIFSSVLHFMQTAINPCWASFSIAIVGVLTSIGCFCGDFAMKFMEFLTKLNPRGSSKEHQTEESGVDAQCEHSNCSRCRDQCDPRCTVCKDQSMFTEESLASLVSLMVASVSAWCGYKGEGPGTSIAKGLFNFQKNFWLTIYQSGRFLTEIVKLIARIYKWIAKKAGFGNDAITLTEENNSVKEFITEATKMLDERNLQFLDTSPAIKYRFWYAVTAAHQMIAKFSGSNLPEATSICRLAFKLIERGNRVSIQSMACPVRYEPFVLAIEGASRIGKSYMFQQMLPKLLASDAYNIRTHAPPVCVRTPGVQFWNTYQNQPCILYDDFLAVTTPEIAVPQVIELYNLKSSAQFNLNMANLEEKKMLGNPFLVALSCNNAFTCLNGTVHPQAFLRRKEHLWKITLKPGIETIDDATAEQKENFNMYEFRRYRDPGNPCSLEKTAYCYSEWYRIVQKDAAEYHKKEQMNVRKRLDGLKELLPETARQMMHEVDPFRIFYSAYTGAADDRSLSQGGLLPSELIDVQLRELVNMPENGGRVVDIEGNRVEPDESEVLAQMDMTKIGSIIPEQVKQWYKTMLYVDPQQQEPPRWPEKYIATGECGVCNEERELTFGCANNHKICTDCNTGIRTASEDVNDVLRYYCATCRSDLYELTETPTMLANGLKPLIWYYSALATGKQIYHYSRGQVSALISMVKNNRMMMSTLQGALLIGYLSGMSYLCASSAKQNMTIQDDWTNMWKDSDDLWNFSYITNWGPFFYATRDNLSRSEWRDRMFGVQGQMDEDNWADTLPYLNNVAGYETQVRRIIRDPENTGPEGNVRFSDLTESENQELEQFIDVIEPQKVTLKNSCRHLALLRTNIDDVCFKMEDCGKRTWEIGIFNGEVIYDYPCQHANCAWNDRKTRFNFLNRWANVNTTYIKAQKRQWERTNGMLPLPEEFFRADALAVVAEQRNEMVRAIENFGKQSWYDYLSPAFSAITSALKVGLKVAFGIMAFLETFRFLKSCMFGSKSESEGVNAQLIGSGSYNTRRIQRRTMLPTRNTATAQLSAEVEQNSVSLVEKNTIFLRVTFEENGVKVTKVMRGLGLFGRTYLIPAHYAKYILKKKSMITTGQVKDMKIILERFVNRECNCTIDMTKESFRFTQTDMAYAVTPPEFPMFRDITNFIPTLEQHKHIGGEYLYVECEQNQQRITAIPGNLLGMIGRQRVRATENWDAYDVYDAYLTTYGRAGSCGSVLITELNAPLFAFHVAADMSNPHCPTGYALPLVREDIEDLKKGVSVLSYWAPALKDPVDAQMHLEGTILPMGAVGKNMVAFMPTKTKIVPSLLQGQIEDEKGDKIPLITQPGVLSPHDARYKHDGSPLYHGCMKHTQPPQRFDDKILEYCIEQVSNELNYDCKPMRDVTQELTITESIVGFNDRKYYDCIDLNTSAGWPWNTNMKKTKKDFIHVVRDKHSNVTECKVEPELQEVLEFNQQLRRDGIRPFTVFLDWLKDERRKEKKIKLKDGTRIFSLSPVDLTIQIRQRYLDFAASFMFYREKTESAVGIVVDGPEWSRLANGLLNNSHHIVTGDYTDFGPRLASQMVRAAFEIMIRWYQHNGLEDPTILTEMRVLAEEIANANHIMHDFIYQTMCGAPSGSPLTVIVNSLVNILYMRYAWMKLFPQSTPEEYKQNVWLKVYGDDLIMSVKPEKIAQFNCKVLSEVFAEYDIVFTDAGKTGTEEYTTLDKATFLKCGFIPHPKYDEHWLSPLEETSIHECAQWVWKSYDLTTATLENVEQSLRLAYGHGPDYFNAWKKCLNRALTNARMPNISLTWDRVDDLFFKLEELNGVFEECTRFDDGLGLNAFASYKDKELKEELRARTIRSNVLKFLTSGPSD